VGGDISIGAIGAALIAGIVSLLGLIISKEQKTSEFRQTWVDSLRSEITSYLTGFNAIADALLVTYANQNDKVAALSSLYSKFNEAGYAITLRLNPGEDRSKAVLACMKRFNQLASNEVDMIPAKIKPIEIDFLASSKELLKYEWKRVKRGEPTFWVTKALAALVIIAALLALPFLSSKKDDTAQKAAVAAPTVVNNVRTETNDFTPSTVACPVSSSRGPKNGKVMREGISNRSARNSPRGPDRLVCRRL
jgi:hypothetical protein